MDLMKDIVVEIKTGKIRGKIARSYSYGQFYSFQGIPYAQPPLGHLRFKAPVPADSWSGILDATHEGSECLQRNLITKELTGSEDCLTLNVYTSTIPDNDQASGLKPVMVWIHGGGFMTGSGSSEIYGPEFLMTEDIVLVTINYRLNVFGFLSLEDPDLDVPGNAGLKDMVMALKWVQENIIYFHGDRNNVTIFGESAGAAASHYLILSPAAKGLFHKAILQSGCAINVWAKGEKCAKKLGDLIGMQTTDERKILKELQDMPAETLFKIADQIPDHLLVSALRSFGPVIERNHKSAFLTEDPLNIIKSGKYNKVSIILGYTNREGIFIEVFRKPKPFQPPSNFELAIPHFLKIQNGTNISQNIAQRIKKFYFGEEEPSDKNKDMSYLLDTDNLFAREILFTARYHCETSPVFLYRMSIESDLNMMKNLCQITEPGVCHADDLGYLFKNLLTPEIEKGSIEETAIKRFVLLWTNFAKYGNPNSEGKNSLVDVDWKPVTPNAVNYLDIGQDLVTGVNPESDRMSFWVDIFKINPIHKL